jgi:putative tricarboxylic transport membrane protein
MRVLVKLAVASVVLLAAQGAAAFPDKAITIVVPSAPGGSGDMVARTLLRVNQEKAAFGVPLVVQNSPGGGGAVASQQVRAATPDGHTILALHQGLITAHALGVVDYGPEAFEPVAQVTGQCLVYTGAPGSAFSTYPELVEASQTGTRVREAANIGAPAHFASMLLNRAAGAEVGIVQAGQAAERLASLMGGHTDVSIFSVAEVLAYKDNGVQPLVILAAERDSALPDVPTAAELGYDAEFCIGNWLMAPKGTPQAVIDRLVEGFAAIFDDEEVQAEFVARGFEPRLITGEEFVALIESSTEAITALAATLPRQ